MREHSLESHLFLSSNPKPIPTPPNEFSLQKAPGHYFQRILYTCLLIYLPSCLPACLPRPNLHERTSQEARSYQCHVKLTTSTKHDLKRTAGSCDSICIIYLANAKDSLPNKRPHAPSPKALMLNANGASLHVQPTVVIAPEAKSRKAPFDNVIEVAFI